MRRLLHQAFNAPKSPTEVEVLNKEIDPREGWSMVAAIVASAALTTGASMSYPARFGWRYAISLPLFLLIRTVARRVWSQRDRMPPTEGGPGKTKKD